ncbi:MAG: hypothetical protein ABH829_02995, partial [archaeon]
YRDCIRMVVDKNMNEAGMRDYASPSELAFVSPGSDTDTIGDPDMNTKRYILDGLHTSSIYTVCTEGTGSPSYCDIDIELGRDVGRVDGSEVIGGIKLIQVDVSGSSAAKMYVYVKPKGNLWSEATLVYSAASATDGIHKADLGDGSVVGSIRIHAEFAGAAAGEQLKVVEVDAYKDAYQYYTCAGVATSDDTQSALYSVKSPFLSAYGEGNFVMVLATRENKGLLAVGNGAIPIDSLITAVPVFNKMNPSDPIIVKMGVRT